MKLVKDTDTNNQIKKMIKYISYLILVETTTRMRDVRRNAADQIAGYVRYSERATMLSYVARYNAELKKYGVEISKYENDSDKKHDTKYLHHFRNSM